MYIMKDKVFDLKLNTIEKHELEKKIVDTITEITSSLFRARGLVVNTIIISIIIIYNRCYVA